MRSLFGLLYTFLFFSYIVTGLFIVFHLVRYSLSRFSAVVGTAFFLAVLLILLYANAMIFFTLPFEGLLPVFPGSPSSNSSF